MKSNPSTQDNWRKDFLDREMMVELLKISPLAATRLTERITEVIAKERSEERRRTLEEAIVLVKARWTFAPDQRHTHSWHDMADTIEALSALIEQA